SHPRYAPSATSQPVSTRPASATYSQVRGRLPRAIHRGCSRRTMPPAPTACSVVSIVILGGTPQSAHAHCLYYTARRGVVPSHGQRGAHPQAVVRGQVADQHVVPSPERDAEVLRFACADILDLVDVCDFLRLLVDLVFVDGERVGSNIRLEDDELVRARAFVCHVKR